MTTLSIHRVTSVTATIQKRRASKACEDHDVYELEIVSESAAEPQRDEVLRVTLFCAPDAWIGLNLLVDDEAAQ